MRARVSIRSPRPSSAVALAARAEGLLVRLRPRLPWVHAFMLLAFLALILGPLALSEPAENATALEDFTRLANYLMWGLWFPLVLLSVVAAGRAWCGLLCPMGAASEWASRRGRGRPIPRWLRWEGTPVVSFLLVTVLGQTLGVRDHPEAMAGVFGGTLLAAMVLGFLYARGKRPWCRHACPIGLLLGVFSRLGALDFAAKRPRPGGDSYTETGVCPTLIHIPRKQESRHCIECLRCVKPASPGGLYLRLRPPGQEVERIRHHNPNGAELAFLALGTGTALGGFLWLVLPAYQEWRQALGAWLLDQGWLWALQPGPAWLMSVHPDRREVFTWLDFGAISGFMLGWALVIGAALALTTLLGAWLAGRLGGDRDLRGRFLELGYQYAPVALVSLVVGLGGGLFAPLDGMTAGAGATAKGGLLAAGLLWSLRLGWRLLEPQGLRGLRRGVAWLPGALGSVLVGAAWWPALGL